MNELRKELKKEVQITNKQLPDSHLDKLSNQALINNTHPLYRHLYQNRLDNLVT